MKRYEVTFEWPNGDWTWVFILVKDFHEAMLQALILCPATCRVHRVVWMPTKDGE